MNEFDKLHERSECNLFERVQFFPNCSKPFNMYIIKWEPYLAKFGDILIPQIVYPFNYIANKRSVCYYVIYCFYVVICYIIVYLLCRLICNCPGGPITKSVISPLVCNRPGRDKIKKNKKDQEI